MKAIQATYYDSSAIQLIGSSLKEKGYQYRVDDVRSFFYGNSITVEVPSGRGKEKRVAEINKILGKGINIYLSPKKYAMLFP